MTQQDRDRLVALKKAKKGLITQRQAAEEIGQTERHVRRLLQLLKSKGDRAVVLALRGRPSNRKLDEKTKQNALEILAARSIAASVRRWRQNTWPANTTFTWGAKRCGPG